MSLQYTLKTLLVGVLFLYCIAISSSIAVVESLSFLMFLAAMGICGYYLAKRQVQWNHFESLHFVGLALFLAIFISFYFAPSDFDFLKVLVASRWWVFLFSTGLLLWILRDKQELFIQTLFVVAGIISLYSIFSFMTGLEFTRPNTPMHTVNLSGEEVLRVRGVYSHVMSYSYMLGMPFVAALAGILMRPFSPRFNKYLVALALVMLTSLVLTFTRGVWIAVVITAFVLAAVHSRKAFTHAILVSAMIAVIGMTAMPDMAERLISGVADAEKSISNRFKLWEANLAMFEDHPLTGVGWGENKSHLAEYNQELYGEKGFVARAHSNYLSVLAGGGVIVFCLWAAFFLIIAYRSLQLYRNPARSRWRRFVGASVFAVSVFFHIAGLTQSSFLDKEPLFMYMFFCSLLVANLKKPQFIKVSKRLTHESEVQIETEVKPLRPTSETPKDIRGTQQEVKNAKRI